MKHFEDVAPLYDDIRETEIWPSLVRTMVQLDVARGLIVDVATGTGLYGVRLAEHGYHVIGVDSNRHMLAQAVLKARRRKCDFRGLLGSAEQIPVAEGSIRTMMSTNAIHHFDLPAHVREVIRILQPGGCYVVFTRFQEQNKRSLWGQMFPGFAAKENRLYHPHDFEQVGRDFPELVLEAVEELAFENRFCAEHLLEVARCRKYSTFAFYNDSEFRRACDVFRVRLAEWREDHYTAEIGKVVFRRQ